MNKHIYLITSIILFINLNTYADTEYRVKCVPDSVIFNDILGCYIDEYNDIDKKLNLVYKNKLAKLNKNKRDKLIQLQHDWLKKKELSCIVDEANYGRESHFDAMQCQIDMTKERLIFLKNYQ